jgi:hypothetical protein
MDFRKTLLLYENVNWFAEDQAQERVTKEKKLQIAKHNSSAEIVTHS